MNELQYKVALFDADGVTVQAPKFFSHIYAAEHGVDPAAFIPFFKGDFQLARTGKVDLKDLLVKHADLWRWGDPEEIIRRWCESENYPNHELIDLIQQELKPRGIVCCLATNHEANCAKFLHEQVFPGVFDEIFASSSIGFTKSYLEFFSAVLKNDKVARAISSANQIAYFDNEKACVETAKTLGLEAVIYESVAQVRQLLLG